MPARAVRYDNIAMIFHWVIALLVIANICLGLYMGDLPRGDPDKLLIVQTHQSIGLTVLVLSLLRLGWRLMHPAPRLPPGMHPVVAGFAHFTHAFFYFLIIVIPLSGWLMMSAWPPSEGTNYFGLFDWPNLGFFAGQAPAQRHAAHEMFETVHVWLAWSAIVLVPLHVAAALYHHFVRGDDVLRRMVPGMDVRDA